MRFVLKINENGVFPEFPADPNAPSAMMYIIANVKHNVLFKCINCPVYVQG